jgi:polar amino acid transport system substrate-binding protein
MNKFRPRSTRFLHRLFTVVFLFAAIPASAETFRISLAQQLIDPAMRVQLQLLEEAVPGTKFDITARPFARSVQAAIAGEADAHLPIIRVPDRDNAPFRYATANIGTTTFFLYTNAIKPLDRTRLGQYRIEVSAAHADLFSFPVVPTTFLEGSLRKVAAGRIDGYIDAGVVADEELARLGLTTLHREFYRRFDVTFLIAPTDGGTRFDRYLSSVIEQVRTLPAFIAAGEAAGDLPDPAR